MAAQEGAARKGAARKGPTREGAARGVAAPQPAGQGAWAARPAWLALREPPRRAALGVVNLAVLALVAAIVGLYTLGQLRGEARQLRGAFPVEAFDAIAADLPPGHMLDLYEWGG